MIRGVLGRNPTPATDPGGASTKGAAAKGAKADAKAGKAAGNTASPVSAIMGRFKRVLGVPERTPKARRY